MQRTEQSFSTICFYARSQKQNTHPVFSRSPGHSHNAGMPNYPPLGRGNTLPMNGVNNYAELAYDEEEDTYDDDYEDYDQVRPIFELILFS